MIAITRAQWEAIESLKQNVGNSEVLDIVIVYDITIPALRVRFVYEDEGIKFSVIVTDDGHWR